MDDLSKLSALSIFCGLAAGIVILGFRFLTEWGQTFLLPSAPVNHSIEFYSGLTPIYRLTLCTVAGLIIGIILHNIHPEHRKVGVTHVLERVVYYNGFLPIKNALVQFFLGAFSIIAGHSVGREGPNIHLGATASSLLSRTFKLDAQQTRVLIGSGVAAAIAASFNTPLAGVIFAMEVIIMEYSVTGFIPVILAAVSATILTWLAYGHDVAFVVPTFEMENMHELMYIILMGLIIGALASFFIALLRRLVRITQHIPIWICTTTGGFATGVCAWLYPSVMGIGYDTVNLALMGTLSLSFLVGFVIFKIIASSFALGLGLPGGIISPSIVIGAGVGGIMGLVANQFFPEQASHPGLYVMLGMAGMMGAMLQAPLAALTAILELTANPHMILPGMLVIVTSCLVCSQIFRTDSIFLTLLKDQGFIVDKKYIQHKTTPSNDS